jgi:hypothetical protein
MVKVGQYDYKKSTRSGKKLMVEVQGKIIHFGGPVGSKHFFDKTKLLDKKLNHKDEKVRKAWKARHGEIKLKSGKKAVSDPSQPAYHAWHVLW